MNLGWDRDSYRSGRRKSRCSLGSTGSELESTLSPSSVSSGSTGGLEKDVSIFLQRIADKTNDDKDCRSPESTTEQSRRRLDNSFRSRSSSRSGESKTTDDDCMYCDTFQNERQYFLWRSRYVRSSYCSRCSGENSDIPYISYWGKPSYENGSWRKRYKEGRNVDIDLSPLLEVLHRIDRIDTSMGRPNYHRLSKKDDATGKHLDKEDTCKSHLTRIADDLRSKDHVEDRLGRYTNLIEGGREVHNDKLRTNHQKNEDNICPTNQNEEIHRDNNFEIYREEQYVHPETICDEYRNRHEITDSFTKHEHQKNEKDNLLERFTSHEETNDDVSDECFGPCNRSTVNQQTAVIQGSCTSYNKANILIGEMSDLSHDENIDKHSFENEERVNSLCSVSTYPDTDIDQEMGGNMADAFGIQAEPIVDLHSTNTRNNDKGNCNDLASVERRDNTYDQRNNAKYQCLSDSNFRNEEHGRIDQPEKRMTVKDIISNIETNRAPDANYKLNTRTTNDESESSRCTKPLAKATDEKIVVNTDDLIRTQRYCLKQGQNVPHSKSGVTRKENIENELNSVKLRKTSTALFQRTDGSDSVEMSGKSKILFRMRVDSESDRLRKPSTTPIQRLNDTVPVKLSNSSVTSCQTPDDSVCDRLRTSSTPSIKETDSSECQSNKSSQTSKNCSIDSNETQVKASRKKENIVLPQIIVQIDREEHKSDIIDHHATQGYLKSSHEAPEKQDRHQENDKIDLGLVPNNSEISNRIATTNNVSHKGDGLKTESVRQHDDSRSKLSPEVATMDTDIRNEPSALRRKSVMKQSQTPEDSENKSGNVSKSRGSPVMRYQQKRRLSRSQRDRRSSLHKVRFGIEDEDDEYMKIQQKLNTLGKYSARRAPTTTVEQTVNTLSIPKTIWNRNIRNAIYGQPQFRYSDDSKTSSDYPTEENRNSLSEDETSSLRRGTIHDKETLSSIREKTEFINEKPFNENKLTDKIQNETKTDILKHSRYSNDEANNSPFRTSFKNRQTKQFLTVPGVECLKTDSSVNEQDKLRNQSTTEVRQKSKRSAFTAYKDKLYLSDSSTSETSHKRKAYKDKAESSSEASESQSLRRRSSGGDIQESSVTKSTKTVVELDSDDEESSKLQWRARGYSNDFYFSRKSRTGGEIIEQYRQLSNKSSKTTSPISSADSSRKSSISSKQWVRKPWKRLGSLEENSLLNIAASDHISSRTSRSERSLSESHTKCNQEDASGIGINADLLKVALERATRCTARLDKRLESQLL